jgi:HPt (histidine-containing phosphotransfer) domain-containing protein
MDVQMPEMSGIEATQAIRARERPGERRLPIVALTAHAMQGDRERCLESGMDGYLSKPIDVDDLLATVENVAGETMPPAPPAIDGAEVFDERVALAYTGGDRRLLTQIVGMFRSDCSSSMRRIGRAVDRRDGEALRMASHAFKGALATIGASRARAVAAELEQTGRASQFDVAGNAHRRLREELAALDRALDGAGFGARPRRSGARRRRARPEAKATPRARKPRSKGSRGR